MYKIKRFSILGSELAYDMYEKIYNRLLPSKNIKIPTSKFSLFGGGNKSSNSPYYLGGTVKSSYRLRSYLNKFDVNEFKKVLESTTFKFNNSEFNCKDYVLIGGDKKSNMNFYVINKDTNPILVYSAHKSWDSLIEYSLLGYDQVGDYYTYVSDDIRYLYVAIDDYGLLAKLLSVYSIVLKVYGSVAYKSNLIVE